MMTAAKTAAGMGQPGKFAITIWANVSPLMPIHVMDDITRSSENIADPFLPNTVRDRNDVDKPVSNEMMPVDTAMNMRNASPTSMETRALTNVI